MPMRSDGKGLCFQRSLCARWLFSDSLRINRQSGSFFPGVRRPEMKYANYAILIHQLPI